MRKVFSSVMVEFVQRFLSPRCLVVVASLGMMSQTAPAQEVKVDPKAMTKSDSGLQSQIVTEGTGATPKAGQTAVVHYTGWLWENEAKGDKFDSSKDRGRPFTFPVGRGRVIKGWDEGVAEMKVGEKRLLLIPPHLAYGETGVGPIPPNATLLFEVELLGIQ